MSECIDTKLECIVNDYISRCSLPSTYLHTFKKWFLPLLEKINAQLEFNKGPLVLGVNGCQGSGKTTLSNLISEVFNKFYGKSSVSMSIDDFYLTQQERKNLSDSVHSLLMTRGVPGTHDIKLATSVIEQLKQGHGNVEIPRFDKSIDDRAEKDAWSIVSAPIDLIVIEGWCLGSPFQEETELYAPVNDLEEFEDRSMTWREYVNEKLSHEYRQFFNGVDFWVMLKAPSFECVYEWRLEQEQKLKKSLEVNVDKRSIETKEKLLALMSPQQIKRFIQYYQRITENTLRLLPQKCDVVFELNSERSIITASGC